MVAWVVDGMFGLEEEIRASCSFMVQAYHEVTKVRTERDEVEAVVAHLNAYSHSLERNVSTLHQDAAYLQNDLVKSKEEIAYYYLEVNLLEEERNACSDWLAYLEVELEETKEQCHGYMAMAD